MKKPKATKPTEYNAAVKRLAKPEPPEMATEHYNAALKRLDISIVGASRYLGISRRQAQRIAGGECPVPAPIAKLLRIVINHRVSLEELAK